MDAGTYSNSTAIGANSLITTSNQVVLGNANITEIRAQVTSITAISDLRKKKDVAESELGLSFINSLRPVQYRFNNGDDTLRYGFIAQETEKALPEKVKQLVGRKNNGLALVNHDNDEDGTYHMSYGELISPLVKAVQEQQRQIEELRLLVIIMGSLLMVGLCAFLLHDKYKIKPKSSS